MDKPDLAVFRRSDFTGLGLLAVFPGTPGREHPIVNLRARHNCNFAIGAGLGYLTGAALKPCAAAGNGGIV